jgi:hypothetical protein
VLNLPMKTVLCFRCTYKVIWVQMKKGLESYLSKPFDF